jgi:hypothetical protein
MQPAAQSLDAVVGASCRPHPKGKIKDPNGTNATELKTHSGET